MCKNKTKIVFIYLFIYFATHDQKIATFFTDIIQDKKL